MSSVFDWPPKATIDSEMGNRCADRRATVIFCIGSAIQSYGDVTLYEAHSETGVRYFGVELRNEGILRIENSMATLELYCRMLFGGVFSDTSGVPEQRKAQAVLKSTKPIKPPPSRRRHFTLVRQRRSITVIETEA
ncbi:hypothetical protein RE428_49240 (plasmid) [Marinobacter nanhaiticus D15-8W]|uniref:Uncharacterized protein n=1 Tax=Marinobacter nanhaiticus D15-8W TaxID=626887 RepID=N6WAC5_9GAMM|nr:hypothetical protein J057_00874 [Marinobacter nanhaiticus D15-8W]BES73906.1 hypothetical protein RE428_49240 [Marinobacter nanhaiticus D15-8W]